MTDIEQKWLSQMRKGYLEMCIMVVLREQQKSYGFALLRDFQNSGMDLNEGTLYPLLNRMHKNGWLESSWETPVDGGHPRRFYCLSKTGKNLLPAMLDTFQQLHRSLAILMGKS